MDVSVIMPVYNGAKYVEKAVESVLKQQGVAFDLWLVDDGSTDESPEICDAYAKVDSRVHVIHQKNQGPGIARNAAIERASGEFVFFLDCDDWLVDHALDYLYHLAQAKNADIVCYGIRKTRDREEMYDFHDAEHVCVYEGEDVLRRYFTKMTATICKLFRRRIFDHYRFEAVQLCEDAWSMHLFFSEAKIMLVTDTICYVQYLHDDSRSRKEFSSQKFISEICGKRMVEFAGESRPEVYGEALYNLIRRQIRLLYDIVRANKYREYKDQYQQILNELKEERAEAEPYRQTNEDAWKLMTLAVKHPLIFRGRDRIKAIWKR